MRYLDVCAGISASTVAWQPLGWSAAAYSEIEPFPRAVLKHHYPDTPRHGDFTTIGESDYGAIDLLVGGTPCQAFSTAGLRKGLDDPRGNLALAYLALARRKRARWVVWENVPGVLSSGEGRDFGAFLGGLAELGYGFAWRVLDAQYFGVPQRRRRVFLVGHSSGRWGPPAAVLFEPDCLRRDTPPRRKPGTTVAATLRASSDSLGGAYGSSGFVGQISLSNQGAGGNKSGHGPDEPHSTLTRDGGPNAVVVAFSAHDDGSDAGELSPTLRSSQEVALARESGEAVLWSIMPQNGNTDLKARAVSVTQPLLAAGPGGNGGGDLVQKGFAVRRLTPVECERLQGFPDDYTRIGWRKKPPERCPDGLRYKVLGNSMAVPVMRWLGERIAAVDAMRGPDGDWPAG